MTTTLHLDLTESATRSTILEQLEAAMNDEQRVAYEAAVSQLVMPASDGDHAHTHEETEHDHGHEREHHEHPHHDGGHFLPHDHNYDLASENGEHPECPHHDEGHSHKPAAEACGHHHHHDSEEPHCHNINDVCWVVDRLALTDEAKAHMKAIYRILAEAEASVHGCDIDKTHFHEVGRYSGIRNVAVICLALEALGWPQVTATDVQTGQGKVLCAHGELDIPAPATAAIIARGIPTCRDLQDGELLTPTSAAIVLHFAFGKPQPKETA